MIDVDESERKQTRARVTRVAAVQLAAGPDARLPLARVSRQTVEPT